MRGSNVSTPDGLLPSVVEPSRLRWARVLQPRAELLPGRVFIHASLHHAWRVDLCHVPVVKPVDRPWQQSQLGSSSTSCRVPSGNTASQSSREYGNLPSHAPSGLTCGGVFRQMKVSIPASMTTSPRLIERRPASSVTWSASCSASLTSDCDHFRPRSLANATPCTRSTKPT